MLDIVLALQWVRANIAQLGGDPANVTIFGESGGGFEVSVLMAMPVAEGLFHKAIVESGSQLCAISPEEADRETRRFLAEVHVAPDRVGDLLNIPFNQLVTAQHSMSGGINLRPVLDARSLHRHPFDPDAPPGTAKVPMLIGTTADEDTIRYGIQDPGVDRRISGRGMSHRRRDSRIQDIRPARLTLRRAAGGPGDVFLFAL